MKELRCKCGKKLGENLYGRVEIVCHRCGYFNKFTSSTFYKSHKLIKIDNVL